MANKIDIIEKIKNTSISQKVSKNFMYGVISVMVEYFGLEFTTDNKLILSYTPTGSQVDYLKILEDKCDNILKFLDINLPKKDKNGLINLMDLFDAVVMSDKFNRFIFSYTELTYYLGKEDALLKKLAMYFSKYVEKTQGPSYKYPYQDILLFAFLDYNFPNAKVYKFIKESKLKVDKVKDKGIIIDKITAIKWLPELTALSSAYFDDLLNEFDAHIKMVYKLKSEDYIATMSLTDIKEDFANFYQNIYSPE